MEEVLRLDKSNTAVKPELEELQEMKTKMDQEKKVAPLSIMSSSRYG